MFSPIKSIRKYCLECCCYSANEVRLCPTKECPLYPYRFGKRVRNPTSTNKPKRTLSPEHLKKMQEGRLKSKMEELE